jgi:PAS domain S-box-containing protein
MDSMRKTVDSIEKTEQELLRQRQRRENQLQALTHTSLLLNAAFAVALATGLSLLLASGARKLQSANHELTEQMARRERLEREAEILNEHNEMILQAARDGIAGINQSGRTTFFNPAAEAITGYSAAEAIGKFQHDLLHFKRADGTPYPVEECPIMATLRSDKSPRSGDEVFWRKDGTPVPIEFTSAPLVMRASEEDFQTEDGIEGRHVGAVIIFRDVTERRKSEQAMQELASIVQYSDDAIIGLNLKGVITRWNRAATKLYGYNEFEMVGQYMDKLIPSDMTDELPDLLEKLRRHQPVDRYETVRARKDGSRVQVVLSLSPILNQAGEVTGASTISREVFRNRVRQHQPIIDQ